MQCKAKSCKQRRRSTHTTLSRFAERLLSFWQYWKTCWEAQPCPSVKWTMGTWIESHLWHQWFSFFFIIIIKTPFVNFKRRKTNTRILVCIFLHMHNFVILYDIMRYRCSECFRCCCFFVIRIELIVAKIILNIYTDRWWYITWCILVDLSQAKPRFCNKTFCFFGVRTLTHITRLIYRFISMTTTQHNTCQYCAVFRCRSMF